MDGSIAMGVLRVGRVKRRLTRRSGKGPRIPDLKQIRKAFGGYDSAVGAAGRHFDKRA
jgi:hypothetical protein